MELHAARSCRRFDVVGFQDWLVRSRGVTRSTAYIYSRFVARASSPGGIQGVAAWLHHPGGRAVALAAARRWGEWSGDTGLMTRLRRAATRYRGRPVRHRIPATPDEVSRLLPLVEQLDDPYRSAVIVLVLSGLKLSWVFALTRDQLELACAGPVPIPMDSRSASGDSVWDPCPRVRQAAKLLVEYSGWSRLRDLFGRDYMAAYWDVRYLLRRLSKEAGLSRRLLPGDFRSPTEG